MPSGDESTFGEAPDLRKKVAFVVLSCDKYQDLWPLCIDRLFKCWPTMPLDVYLASNSHPCDDPRVRSLLSGSDPDWSSSIHAAVSQVANPYVFFWFDDAILERRVPHTEVVSYLLWGLSRDVDYLRLRSIPRPNEKLAPNIGRLAEGMPYRVTCFGALWRRDTFLKLLVSGESAAQFEMNGTIRSYAYPHFYGVYASPLSFIHGVVRGKWLRSSYRRLADADVAACANRPVMSRTEELMWKLNELRASIAVNLPPGWANALFSLKRKLITRSR